MLSSNDTVRAMSGFDVSLVPDSMINLRRQQAYYVIADLLLDEYVAKIEANTLTSKEKFELSIGEAELTCVFLCYSLALKFTALKDNRSVVAGDGEVHLRDSQRNADFLRMAKAFWQQAWTSLAPYLDGVPNIAGIGIDGYTDASMSITRNYHAERFFKKMDPELKAIIERQLVN
jgi:hypothetical protein